MNLLDIRTVLFSSIITSAICATVMAWLWQHNRRRWPELKYWLADFVLQFLAVLLIALRGVIPDVVSVVFGVPFSLFGALLMFIGLERHMGKPGVRRYNFGLLALFIVVHVYFIYGLPSLPVRNINFSLGLLVFCGQCAWLLLRRVGADLRAETKVAGAIFGIYSLISLLRILVDLAVPQSNDLFKSGLYDVLAVLIYQMLLIGLAFALSLLVNRRLFTALETDITARQQAEESIQSLAKFPSENPNPVLRLRSDGVILYGNEASHAILQDWGCAAGDAAPPLWQTVVAAAFTARISRYIDVESAGRVWSFFVTPIVEAGYINLYGQDITERKEIEDALRASEYNYRSILEQASDGIFIADANGRYIEVNSSGCDMLGYTRDEILTKSISDLVAPDDLASTPLRIDELRQGKAITSERQLICKDGTVLLVEISARMLPDGRLQAIQRDITARKRVEQAVAASQKLLQDFTDNSTSLIYALDPHGRFLLINRRLEAVLGVPRETLIGKTREAILPPDIAAAHRTNDLKVMNERQPLTVEEENIEPDGQHVYFSVKFPLLDSAGQVQGVGGISTDITERKRAEETLLESDRKLREAQEMAHLGFWLWDIKTGAVEWSEEIFKIFGLDPKAFTPHIDSILAMSPWAEDHQRDQELIKRAIETHSPGSYEQKFLRPDQSIGHYYSTFQGNYDEQGDLHSIVGTVLDITDRKQAEEALRLSETNYRTLMEQASDGIFIADANGNYTDVNSQGCAMLGFSREEILQLNLKDVLLPEDIAVIPVRMIELHAGQVILSERRMRRKDGSIFSAEISGKRLADDRLQGIVRDITERKRAEEEIRQRAEEIRTLMEVTPVAIWVASDPQCLHITGNQAGNQFYEAVGEENVSAGSTGVRRFFRDGRELAADELTMQEAARLGQDIRNSELDVLLPSGRWMTIWGNATPLRDAAGNVRGCIGAFMDITDRKRMEEALRQTNEQLEQRVAERTAELSDLYNHAPCGYHSLDANGVFVRINDTELQWLGYTREEVIGRLAATDLFTPASVETFNQNFPVFKTRGWLRDLELDMVRKDGSILSILLNATLMVDQDGRYLMSRSTMIDHTDRKQAESQREAALEAMRVSQAQLAASNKELEAFAYSVSHDLRAPLRAIDGFSRILLEDYADQFDAEGQRLFGVVRTNAQKMDRLITDLLALSRITRSEMVLSRIDMTTLVHTVYEDITLPDVQAQFVLSIAPLPEADGDPTLMRQVWSNLLANAIKYTLPKSVRHIEVGGYRQGDEYIYFVKDTGVGFNPAYTHKLFGAFQRLHKAEEFEGTGVGLAIVQRIIQRHGGRVWAEGQVNAGATFYFSLPYSEADREPSL